jgi:Alpha/beta hydrolase family
MDGISQQVERWLWIGGWASSVEVWKPWIAETYPTVEHAFLAVESLMGLEPEDLDRVLVMPGGMRPDVVLAWSLGSHVALRSWNAGAWPLALPLIAICPVVEFCAQDGPWKPMVLNRMIRALGRDREAVLEDFRRLMWPEMPEDLATSWKTGAALVDEIALVRGLELLRDGSLGTIRPGAGLFLVEGRNDDVSPRLEAVMPPEEITGLVRFQLDAGHVPFLQDPRAFGQILSQCLP